jgi:hypothetical protein
MVKYIFIYIYMSMGGPRTKKCILQLQYQSSIALKFVLLAYINCTNRFHGDISIRAYNVL